MWAKSASHEGNLFGYPVRRGVCKLLKGVAYRKSQPVAQHVVVRRVRGLPAKRDESAGS